MAASSSASVGCAAPHPPAHGGRLRRPHSSSREVACRPHTGRPSCVGLSLQQACAPQPPAESESQQRASRIGVSKKAGRGGAPPLPLSPFPIELKFSKVKLWAHVGRSQQMNGAAANIDGLMPVVGAAAKDPTMLQRTKPSVALLHTLLAVHHFTPPPPPPAAPSSSSAAEDEETRLARALAASNVAGYVVVQDVSLERQTIAVLAPSPAALPSLHLVCGTVKWLEH